MLWLIVVLGCACLAGDVLTREHSSDRRWKVRVGLAKRDLALAVSPEAILKAGKAELARMNAVLVMAGLPPILTLADLRAQLQAVAPDDLPQLQVRPEESRWWPLVAALQDAASQGGGPRRHHQAAPAEERGMPPQAPSATPADGEEEYP